LEALVSVSSADHKQVNLLSVAQTILEILDELSGTKQGHQKQAGPFHHDYSMINNNNGYQAPTEDGGLAPPSASHTSGEDFSQMNMVIQQQDNILDQISQGVSRLYHQSSMISEESRMHNALLNEMETNLDAAHEGLGAEARRAARMREDGSIWKLQLIVAGLSILFVFLLLMGHH
jgi:hypothetical protein